MSNNKVLPSTLHTSASQPHSVNLDSHTICLCDSLSPGPLTSTNYNKSRHRNQANLLVCEIIIQLNGHKIIMQLLNKLLRVTIVHKNIFLN